MPFWAKYGTETTFQFAMVKRDAVDFALTADWTPASGDAAISKNNGNLADCTNTVAIEGGSPTRGAAIWALTLTATELQCATATVQIIDAATKAVEDQSFTVYTYGHASAFFKGDWSDIVRLGLTALPNAAADAAGGLPISDAGGLDLDAKLANTNEVTAARMGALTDWINGGRLDLILDIIATDTTTDIPGLIATAQADLDILTGSDGATLATTQGNYAPAKAGDEMDLVDAPNATAVAAIQSGLATAVALGTPVDLNGGANIADNLVDIYNMAVNASNQTQDVATILDEVQHTTAYTGAIDDESATTTEFDTDLPFEDGALDGQLLTITTFDTLYHQTRVIKSYVAEAGHIVLESPLSSAPEDEWTFKVWSRAALPATATVDLAAFFTTDSGETYASAVAGSVVKEIADNAGGSSLTVEAIADEVQTRTIAAVTTVATTTNLTTLPSIPNNWLTADGINADAFTAAKFADDCFVAANFASDVAAEFQSGLATAAELAKVPKSDSNVTWNATALASINAEADTALTDYGALKPTTSGRTLTVNASGHVERVVLVDTTTTNTDMRGTDSAALASVCTEARLAELDAANLPTDIAAVKTDTAAIKTKTDNLPASFPANFASFAITAAGKVTVGTNDDKTGYSLASTGLDLIVPTDPAAEPVIGTSSIVAWIGYFGIWSQEDVRSDADEVVLRNAAGNVITTLPHSDDGTTFISGPNE